MAPLAKLYLVPFLTLVGLLLHESLFLQQQHKAWVKPAFLSYLDNGLNQEGSIYRFLRGRPAKKLVQNVKSRLKGDESMQRLKEGPWPDCVGQMPQECISFIETYTSDCTFQIVHPTEFAFPDFSHHRVVLYVGHDGTVRGVPSRG